MEKTVWRFFSAKTRRENVADLDRRSREGWNLVRVRWLRAAFARSGGVYRYGLDYCPESFDQQPGRRRAYAAAGWEPVCSTLSGWDYYRRRDDGGSAPLPTPYLPEDEALLCRVRLWFWLRNLIAVSAAPLAVMAVVRQQSMVIPAVVYAAAVLGCTVRVNALQAPLRRRGQAYETARQEG